jgi:hypothetical protein
MTVLLMAPIMVVWSTPSSSRSEPTKRDLSRNNKKESCKLRASGYEVMVFSEAFKEGFSCILLAVVQNVGLLLLLDLRSA